MLSFLLLALFSQNLMAIEGTCFHEHISRPENFQKRLAIQHLKPLYIESEKNKQNIIVTRKRSYEIGLKVLFLSVFPDSTQEPSVDLAKQVFQGRGVPYDHFYLKNPNGSLKNKLPTLIDTEGNPKYYAIILSSAELGFDESGKFKSALNDEEWENLADYERTYNVRRLSLYSFPTEDLGVALKGGDNAEPPGLILSSYGSELDKALPSQKIIPLKNSWHYQTQIIDAQNTKAILHYDTAQKTVAAVTKTLEDGREQMHFFFTQGQWVKASVALTGLWLNWVTKGTYLGNRKIYLNVHVDDFFLATHLWDPEKNIQTEAGKTHRLSPEDFNEFTQWQHFNFRPKTQNPDYRIEFAYNGFGTVVHKPKGDLPDMLLSLGQIFYNQYTWASHTYSHADLNLTSYSETDQELKKNITFTQENFSHLLNFSYYHSKESMVTPKISGLLRTESLSALWDNGIKYVTGDNTRKELLPPHPFTAKYTTKEGNGFPGILILPRNATEIYYNTTSPLELVSEYNYFYAQKLKKLSTFEEIYDREAERVTNNLLKYDASPYMFHQSNMNVFNYKNQKISLLSHWMDRVVEDLRLYSNLPVLSLKMDDLKNLYLNKMAYESCGLKATLKVFNNHFQKIIFKSSQNSCYVPITSSQLKPSSLKNGKNGLQTYGPDTTTFIKMGPKAKNLEINL